MERLFHIYIGKAYIGPMRAAGPQHACERYARKSGKPVHILHAVPAVSVRELKEPRERPTAQ